MQQNNSETVRNEYNQEVPKERCIKKGRALMMIWDWYNSIKMEYQKIINLLDNTPNQSTKFRISNWDEINDDFHLMHNTNS